jgi:hypothetical protein
MVHLHLVIKFGAILLLTSLFRLKKQRHPASAWPRFRNFHGQRRRRAGAKVLSHASSIGVLFSELDEHLLEGGLGERVLHTQCREVSRERLQ